MTPDEIRAFRARLGLSQEALARALPCSVSAIHGWEHGTRTPGPLLARALADLEREIKNKKRVDKPLP